MFLSSSVFIGMSCCQSLLCVWDEGLYVFLSLTIKSINPWLKWFFRLDDSCSVISLWGEFLTYSSTLSFPTSHTFKPLPVTNKICKHTCSFNVPVTSHESWTGVLISSQELQVVSNLNFLRCRSWRMELAPPEPPRPHVHSCTVRRTDDSTRA